jgi:SAM-dependent methyltransferase
MATQQTIDETKVEQFAEQAIGDFSGMLTIALCHVGDRLGLFKELALNGPANASELAERAGINERYAAEWLRGLAAPGYLEYDEETRRYALSPEHALVLAVEGSPAFLGGGYQMFGSMFGPLDHIVRAFREGGGAGQDRYPADFWAGMERFTNSWFENFLVQTWIPSMPDVQAKLEAGCDYADVGCGSGRALIKLAQAYPSSRFAGYDIFQTQVDRARANSDAAGLSDRITVDVADASQVLPKQYDVISTYDVIHDAPDPLGLLKGISQSLKPGGIYVCLDINCADRHEENEGPLAAMFYGFSVFYCMTTSLANGGAGLGTCGFPEAIVRELCEQAGFSKVRRVAIDDPFSSLYEIRAPQAE